MPSLPRSARRATPIRRPMALDGAVAARRALHALPAGSCARDRGARSAAGSVLALVIVGVLFARGCRRPVRRGTPAARRASPQAHLLSATCHRAAIARGPLIAPAFEPAATTLRCPRPRHTAAGRTLIPARAASAVTVASGRCRDRRGARCLVAPPRREMAEAAPQSPWRDNAQSSGARLRGWQRTMRNGRASQWRFIRSRAARQSSVAHGTRALVGSARQRPGDEHFELRDRDEEVATALADDRVTQLTGDEPGAGDDDSRRAEVRVQARDERSDADRDTGAGIVLEGEVERRAERRDLEPRGSQNSSVDR